MMGRISARKRCKRASGLKALVVHLRLAAQKLVHAIPNLCPTGPVRSLQIKAPRKTTVASQVLTADPDRISRKNAPKLKFLCLPNVRRCVHRCWSSLALPTSQVFSGFDLHRASSLHTGVHPQEWADLQCRTSHQPCVWCSIFPTLPADRCPPTRTSAHDVLTARSCTGQNHACSGDRRGRLETSCCVLRCHRHASKMHIWGDM